MVRIAVERAPMLQVRLFADNYMLETQVQPDIRGGLIVEIGDRTIDLSVSAKMARMNKLLQDTL